MNVDTYRHLVVLLLGYIAVFILLLTIELLGFASLIVALIVGTALGLGVLAVVG
ncbi:hypothetical protein [Halobiforma nitratireducens]|uniref:hypothetical protein n=1 Tax=Halobiforma nitratireducens TaxID=130048 RepID=UPI00135F11AA|nr:hypothetical protein [Halobiforma nitratireducens]